MTGLLLLVLVISFFGLLALGLPVAFAIGLSTFCALLVMFPLEMVAQILAQKMMTALDSFGLLAIPFFILAGNLMNTGGIAQRLVDLAKLLAARLPGPLFHCNIIANMLFGAISGSAVSSIAAVGGMMGPIQKREGYDVYQAAAVNIASGPTGLLIPPSNVLILYALVSGGTSVAALFVAGYLPGLLMGLSLMAVAAWLARRGMAPAQEASLSTSQSALQVWLKVWLKALPSLLLIVLVIGGILGGVFTATEASAVAVVYSFLLGLCYRQLSFAKLAEVCLATVRTTAIVLFLVAASVGMSWVISIANLPAQVIAALSALQMSPGLFLLLLNVILLIVGTFMDMTPAVLIFAPLFLPVATELGIDPVHFGIIMTFNLCIGICTPPVGSALFVGCGLAQLPIAKVIPKLLPLYAAMFVVLMAVTYLPALSLYLPQALGLLK